MTEAFTTTAPEPAQKPGNGWAISAFVLGIVAVVAALIPLAGMFLLWVPATAGLGVAITALVKKNTPKALAIIGLVLSIVAVPVGIATFAAGFIGVANVASTSIAESVESAAAQAQAKDVVYTVDGDAGTANVTYTAWVNGVMTSETEDVTLPWTITVHPTYEDSLVQFGFNLSAMGTMDSAGTPVSLNCSIQADGKMLSQDSNTADMPLVNCFG